MSWYRRASAPCLKGGRRRNSAAISATSGRRCSVAAASTRIRSGSKGHAGRDYNEDDIELLLPPLEDMPQIKGYEEVTFEPCSVPPPVVLAPAADTSEEDGDLKPFTKLRHLSEDEIRSILIRYADSKCAFDKNAARDMDITSIDYRPGYKYTLESFTEMRQVCWSFEPYTGGPLDEVNASQPPPEPWDIECSLPKPFQVHSMILDIPHTDVLMSCHVCGGIGSKRCTACSAAGWERCSLCLGDGHKLSLQGHRERCFRCLGTGRKKCWKCGGETIALCLGCGGTGQIRCFIAITLSWSNHVDTDILEPSEALAVSEKLEYANGHLVFQDEKPMIPSVTFPVKDLQMIATALLEKHRTISFSEKLLLQRHGVWAIPVHKVTYEWKQKQNVFFIFGTKNEVYAPDFPESICCCVVS
ncbi:protein SSUH2 [Trichonephila clavata]|uniref:Protein SSUH2 n=1 Tax=Trichonephila clavata TaxID=2740835 RepID=A0A8X6LF37_TRICU|nr:protein SSUH2 [Trichonephila clavata]